MMTGELPRPSSAVALWTCSVKNPSRIFSYPSSFAWVSGSMMILKISFTQKGHASAFCAVR